MKTWLVTMGDFHAYTGRVLKVSWNGRRLDYSIWCEHLPPTDLRVLGKGFTGARLLADCLLITTFNAICRVGLHDGHSSIWIARADFNDLHDIDVRWVGSEIDCLTVANTGSDCIDTVATDGRLLERLALSPRPGAITTSLRSAYFDGHENDQPFNRRRVPSSVHPNSVRWIDGQLWVSRFADRAITVSDGLHRHWIPTDGCPHDLVVDSDRVWFTTTDGRLWTIRRGRVPVGPSLVWNVFESTGLTGWCRGLALADQVILVGLTRVARRVVDRWCNRPPDSTATRLLLLDRRSGVLLDRLDLDSLGLHPKIFQIHPWHPLSIN